MLLTIAAVAVPGQVRGAALQLSRLHAVPRCSLDAHTVALDALVEASALAEKLRLRGDRAETCRRSSGLTLSHRDSAALAAELDARLDRGLERLD
ncbi:MAG: hypothetical protein JNK04_20420 [Myxococcales bacterium]|nr:hypothetical protein [Myxococcales bacterium]